CDTLLSFACFGFSGAVPLCCGGSPQERRILFEQASAVAKEAGRRAERVDAAQQAFQAQSASARESRDHYVRLLSELFGGDFLVLPRFTARKSSELAATFAASTALQGNDSFAAATWFQRVSRVRKAVARLENVLMYAEALTSAVKLNLVVGQLP